MLLEQLAYCREDRRCCPSFASVSWRALCAHQVGSLCVFGCESVVHLDRGGEAGEERRIQVGQKKIGIC